MDAAQAGGGRRTPKSFCPNTRKPFSDTSAAKRNRTNRAAGPKEHPLSDHATRPIHPLLQPEDLLAAVALTDRALGQLDAVLLGRRQLHRMVLAGILSRGHILLEGLPGVGKTALIKAWGKF